MTAPRVNPYLALPRAGAAGDIDLAAPAGAPVATPPARANPYLALPRTPAPATASPDAAPLDSPSARARAIAARRDAGLPYRYDEPRAEPEPSALREALGSALSNVENVIPGMAEGLARAGATGADALGADGVERFLTTRADRLRARQQQLRALNIGREDPATFGGQVADAVSGIGANVAKYVASPGVLGSAAIASLDAARDPEVTTAAGASALLRMGEPGAVRTGAADVLDALNANPLTRIPTEIVLNEATGRAIGATADAALHPVRTGQGAVRAVGQAVETVRDPFGVGRGVEQGLREGAPEAFQWAGVDATLGALAREPGTPNMAAVRRAEQQLRSAAGRPPAAAAQAGADAALPSAPTLREALAQFRREAAEGAERSLHAQYLAEQQAAREAAEQASARRAAAQAAADRAARATPPADPLPTADEVLQRRLANRQPTPEAAAPPPLKLLPAEKEGLDQTAQYAAQPKAPQAPQQDAGPQPTGGQQLGNRSGLAAQRDRRGAVGPAPANPYADTPEPPRVFHGTRAAFDYFDRGKFGSATDAPSAREGIFFAGKPETAESYARYESPARQSQIDALEMEREDIRRLYGDMLDEPELAHERSRLEAIEDELAELQPAAAPNIRPARLAMRNPLVVDYNGQHYREESYFDVIQRAKEDGHDGVILRNTFDSADGMDAPDDIYVVFDGRQIRSAFGPWEGASRVGASGAQVLGAVGGSGVGGAGGAVAGAQVGDTPEERRRNAAVGALAGAAAGVGAGAAGVKATEHAVLRAAGGHDGVIVDFGNLRSPGAPGSGTTYANPFLSPDVLRDALGSRAGVSGATAGAGLVLQQSDDEKLQATGRGLVGLAVAHAIGMPRIRAAGGKVGGVLVGALKEHPAGRWALNTISHDILAAPEVKAAVQAYDQQVAYGRARAQELAARLQQLGPSADRRVSDVIEREAFEPLSGADAAPVLALAQEVSDEFTKLGRAKVGAGLLRAETVAKREGRYLPRMFGTHLADEVGKPLPPIAGTSKPRIKGDRLREELTPEARNALGEVREASFRTARGLDKGYRDVAAAKLFSTLKGMPGVLHPDYARAVDELLTARGLADASGDRGVVHEAQRALDAVRASFTDGAAGYVKLPDTDGMGVLRGAVVRRDVADYLNGIPDVRSSFRQAMTVWKKAHTVYNPGTHAGNFGSNIALAHMAGLPVHEQAVALPKALADLRAYGPATRALAERGVLGHNVVTAGAATPVGGARLEPALRDLAKTTRPETARVLAERGVTPTGRVRGTARAIDQRVTGLYSDEDNLFRVALYQKMTRPTAQGGMGLDPDRAAALVKYKLVDYGTRSPLLAGIRDFASPFVLYPAKALPMLAASIVEHPIRWATLAASWAALDQVSRRQVGAVDERELRPNQRSSTALGYLLPGTVQLPFKNARGEQAVFDIARYTPASAVTGSPVPGSLTTALSDRIPGILNPSGPLVDIGARLTNTDPFTGDKLVQPGATAGDKARAVGQSVAALTLPSALSFHAPRVARDLQNGDRAAAATDALGFAGLRPTFVRPGMQQLREVRQFEEARSAILADLRRDLRAAKTPERQQQLTRDAEQRITTLARRFAASQRRP